MNDQTKYAGQPVNQQLQNAAQRLRDGGATLPAPPVGGTIESAMNHGLCIALAVVEEAIAAAEAGPRWPQVDMGFGKFAVGSCKCAVTGVPGLLYLHLPEQREFNADCADLFPVGSSAQEERIATVIHFHSAETLQQTIDELLAIQREHYPAAKQAQQPADGVVLDAERYRWLRDVSVPPHNFYISVPDEFHGVRYTPAEVDAYIDAALAAHKAQEGGAA